MNLIEAVSYRGHNGAVQHAADLVAGLAARGHRIWLLCRQEAWISAHAKATCDPRQVTVVACSFEYLPPFRELRRIARLVREHGIGVIHAHTGDAFIFSALLSVFAPVGSVATAHAHRAHVHWRWHRRVIAVSDATRTFHRSRNWVRADRIVTVLNAVRYDRFAGVPAATRDEVRAELGVPRDAPLLGMIGRIEPRKGQTDLIRAFARVRKTFPGAHLVLVGAADALYLRVAQRVAAWLGVTPVVHWTGFRQDPERIYRALDLFCLSSFEESSGLAVLEAMAAGLPVVATAVHGVKESVVPGETGRLVPPHRPDLLAEAAADSLRNPAQARTMAASGQQRVRTVFGEERWLAQTEAVLRDAMTL